MTNVRGNICEPREITVPIDDLELHCTRLGVAATVVLVHAGWCTPHGMEARGGTSRAAPVSDDRCGSTWSLRHRWAGRVLRVECE